MVNSSETKKQHSSSVKSSVGTSNNAQGNQVIIQGIISMKQVGMGDSLRQQRQEGKSKTPAREGAMQKSRNSGPRY